ncbi:MAG: hypothetical protein ACQEXV_20635 [Bacillota bacterium]
MIRRENPNRCLKRWRKTFASQGEAGLLEEQRGKAAQEGPQQSSRWRRSLHKLSYV